VAIVSADGQGHVQWMNGEAKRLFHYSEEDVPGIDLCRLLPGTFGADVSITRLQPGTPAELTARTKEGTPVEIDVELAEVSVGGEKMLTLFARDVAERRRQALESQCAKDAAEEALRVRTEYMSDLSHEIRGSMSEILGLTDLALATSLTDEQRECLEAARVGTDSSLSIVNAALDFARIEAGDFELQSVACPIHAIVRETTEAQSARAELKKLELSWSIADNVPQAPLGDPGRLRQVLSNLVENAIKFTQFGDVLVDVDIDEATAGEVVLHFRVKDSGVGIAEEAQKSLFDAVSRSGARRYGGSGLGLSICRLLVERMGGRIWVESRPKQGSTFHFTVRLKIDPQAKEPTNAAPADLPWNLPVLLVESSPGNRLALLQTLKKCRCQPTAVESGKAALAALKQSAEAGEPFPIVMSEWHLPGMDGLALAEKIKSDPSLAATSVILLARRPLQGSRDGLPQLGIEAILAEPVRQSELLRTLQAVWKRRSGARRTAAGLVPDAIAPQASPAPHRVLLVEDNPLIYHVVRRILDKHGYQVAVAFDGQQAVAAHTAHPFEVILMDIRMPVMNGMEATLAIRKREQEVGGHVPIIAMTAHAMSGDRERFLEAGMDGYLKKPVRSEDLLAAVQSAIQNDSCTPSQSSPEKASSAEKSVDGRVFDEATALQYVEGDRELLESMVKIYVANAAPMLAAIRAAIDGRDAKALAAEAHTFKGGVANFYASEAVDAAWNLENAAKANDFDAAAERFAHLLDAVARLDSRLSQFMDKSATGSKEDIASLLGAGV